MSAVTDRIVTELLEDVALEGVRALLCLMGEDPEREGLVDTPSRVVKAYRELADQPGDPAVLLAKVFNDVDYPTDEMIAVGPIEFTSLCEHHLLPFTGQAWVAYIPSPDRGVVGLSKIPRLVEHFARRPQVQERLTTQIADSLVEHLQPRGAAVLIRSTHSCMALRGVRKTGAQMVTSVLRGAFKDDPTVRAEFLALTHDGR